MGLFRHSKKEAMVPKVADAASLQPNSSTQSSRSSSHQHTTASKPPRPPRPSSSSWRISARQRSWSESTEGSVSTASSTTPRSPTRSHSNVVTLKFMACGPPPHLPQVTFSDRSLASMDHIIETIAPASIDKSAIIHGKLLVIDLDQTLVDFNGWPIGKPATRDMFRPNMKVFLRQVAQRFDVGFWSASTAESVRHKMQCINCSKYGIRPVFVLTRQATVKCDYWSDRKKAKKRGCYRIKPIAHVLRLCPAYKRENVMFIDDNPLSVTMSLAQALFVRPWYRSKPVVAPSFGFEPSYGRDETDLLELAYYLNGIVGASIVDAARHQWRTELLCSLSKSPPPQPIKLRSGKPRLPTELQRHLPAIREDTDEPIVSVTVTEDDGEDDDCLREE